MTKTVINIKADKEVKKKAQELARELGVPLSTIVNVYLKDFIRRRKVTFSVDPQMSPRLEKLLERVEKDIKEGRNLSPAFDSAKDAIKYLRSQ